MEVDGDVHPGIASTWGVNDGTPNPKTIRRPGGIPCHLQPKSNDGRIKLHQSQPYFVHQAALTLPSQTTPSERSGKRDLWAVEAMAGHPGLYC